MAFFTTLMAYTSVPKDLTKVKTKVALNLTKRQLICFGAAALVGIPAYIFTRAGIGNSAAALLMIGMMLPLFFLAMYEKDGRPAEKLLRDYIRCKFVWKGKRPYKTENLYEILARGGNDIASQNKAAAKTAVGKRKTGKVKPRRYEEIAAGRENRRRKAAREANGRLFR